MPVNRYFAEGPLQKGDIVSLEGDEFHHLVNATRKRVGEAVELINGCGALAEGKLIEIKKNAGLISIDNLMLEKKKAPEIILIQAIPRLNRLDTIIEKATELGATAIHLFPAETSERKEISSSTLQRLKKITHSAIKQSGHLYLPEILVFSTLQETLPMKGVLFFGDVDPKAPLLIEVLKSFETSIAVVIGPESGLTKKEVELLKEKGAVGVKLSRAILRTDTAPIVALGLITHIILRD